MQVRVALRTLFTKTERFLLRNNKTFILDSGSSASSDTTDDGRNDADIKKYLSDKNYRNSQYFDTLLRGAMKRPPPRTVSSPFHNENDSDSLPDAINTERPMNTEP